MKEEIAKLLDLLELEKVEAGLFRGGATTGETSTRIYGGLIIAQALRAAYLTVEGRPCHSLHAYFLRPGNPSFPVEYRVENSRDGRSFSSRRVTALQQGKEILSMSASFHIEEESWEHQHAMPDVPEPEGVMSRDERRINEAHRIVEEHREDFKRERLIELREIDPPDFFEPEPLSDINHVWFRMNGVKGLDGDIQHCILAYASDMNLLGSALRPHGLTWYTGNVMTASLDHSMWFHGAVDFGQWHLYSMDSPFTGGSRGFNRGSIFTRQGKLIASVAQEGLMRPVKSKK